MKKILFIAIFVAASIAYTYAQNPVYDLVERIDKGSSSRFFFSIQDPQSPDDFFEISARGSRISITGNNYISIATGLNWYLKYYAGIQITWNNPRANLNIRMPKPEGVVRRSTDMLLRYYLNYCTFSYSMPFWSWERWQQEIDWMALHGINLPLSLTGTSSIWLATLKELGYTNVEASEFIAGSGYQAWWMMNNLEGWGGPNPASYYEQQTELEQKIVARYREWGIEPVFAGYAGMVPNNASAKLGLNVQDPGLWCGYRRPAFLQPTDERFSEIANVYYSQQEKLFGRAKYYAIDPFHEGGSIENVDLAKTGTAIYNAMNLASPEAVWVVQSWQKCPYQAMIDQAPRGKVLVLDLFSESRPGWGDLQSPWFRKDGYGGHDWIYCMLLNFGGNVGMFGKLDRVIDSYYLAKSHENGQSLRGVGATPEGIENNPMMFELLYELPWRAEKFSSAEWIRNWPKARYGRTLPQVDEAWSIIARTAYAPPSATTQEGTTESILCARPALAVESVSSWASSKLYYDTKELEKALGLMVIVAEKYRGCNNFEYDIVDLARQTIANRSNEMLPKLAEAFDKGKEEEFKKLSDEFLELILLQDELLASRSEFMVGPWIESAMKMSRRADEQELYRWNARTLITTWGDRTAADKGGLRDYAHREWNGLLRDFYYRRWKLFFDEINSTKMIPVIDWYGLEQEWTVASNPYPTTPYTDPINMATKVYQKLIKR